MPKEEFRNRLNKTLYDYVRKQLEKDIKEGFKPAMEVLEINSAGLLVKDSKSHFVLQAEEKKSFNKIYIYGAILGGGAAFYLMNSEEESKKTGSVSVTIVIPWDINSNQGVWV